MVRTRRTIKWMTASLAMMFCLVAPMQAQETPPSEPAPEAQVPEELVPAITAAIGLLDTIMALDEDAVVTANGATFTVSETAVTLVFDVNADRMRMVSSIGPSRGLGEAQLRRLMQANFDSALDARYAIAQGQIWSTFIHPLTSLTQEDLISGLAQTVTLVQTFGTTFSSGKFVFGGGDSNEELEKALNDLLPEQGRGI